MVEGSPSCRDIFSGWEDQSHETRVVVAAQRWRRGREAQLEEEMAVAEGD